VHELSLRYGLTEIGPVDVSIGIASYPQHAQTDNLLRAADVALYRARAGTRADCEFWDAGGGLAIIFTHCFTISSVTSFL
jgi:predicted signal transduction protein with EAL and GGDEF domain